MTLTNLPAAAGPASAAGAFGLSLALLWLGGAIAAAARAQPAALARVLQLAAVGLTTAGLWWPAHLLSDASAVSTFGASRWAPLLGFGLALALAASVAAAAEALQRARWPAAAVGVLGALALAYVHALCVAPGLFGLGAAGTAALALVVLVAALIAGRGLPEGLRFAPAASSVGAAAAAGVLVLGASQSPAVGEADAASLAVQTLMLSGVALLAGVLKAALGSAGSAGTNESSRRAARRAAAVDSLTQLPTRVYFEAKLDAAARQGAGKDQKLALLFIDLDGFKPVNDTFGHSSGDRVLEQVGARLRELARGRDVAARVGGDEFLLLMYGVASNEAVAKAAAALIARLSEPYTVDGRELGISCSVGIAMFPDGCEPAKLIARADAAMYAAKRSGGAKHAFYTPEMDADVQAKFELVGELRQGLANNELELFFQPKIDARSGKVTAAEALVRWRHPTRGRLMPDEFIPVAERFGLIGALGNWVIEDACRQSRVWRDKGLRMRVAINLSAYQMRQDDIGDRIAQALEKHRIHPSLLTCEITESAAMEDTRATQDAFRRLGELGVHLSIDDFGTGYSSLAYLRKLPAEELKIDRQFIMDLESSADARAVVEAVLKLAHALGLKVVAEGVENTRQQQILVDLGCDEMQGFLFAKPMSARALLLWALGDRTESSVFRTSLFGETREAPRGATLPLPLSMPLASVSSRTSTAAPVSVSRVA